MLRLQVTIYRRLRGKIMANKFLYGDSVKNDEFASLIGQDIVVAVKAGKTKR